MFLTEQERNWIEALLKQNPPAGYQRRAEVLLLTDQGLTSREIAGHTGLKPSGVRYWRAQFRKRRLNIFGDPASQAKSGAPEREDPSSAEAPVPEDNQVLRARTAGKNPAYGRELALDLFDRTLPWHGLSDADRSLLAEAATRSQETPPKTARKDLKAARAWLEKWGYAELAPQEQDKLAALLVLQHGKIKDGDVQRLGFPEAAQKELLIMAGILRIAGGLDEAHIPPAQIQMVEKTPAGLRVVVNGVRTSIGAAAVQQGASLWARAGLPRLEVVDAATAEGRRGGDLPLPLPSESMKLLPDDSLAEAGRKVFLYHFAQMLAHEPGTRLGEDIEELHDMRVATRRMRAAFEVFGEAYEPKFTRPLLKRLRATGRALGHPRDMDVFMEKAHLYLKSLPEDQQTSLDPLLAVWERERQSARQEMIVYLDSPTYAEFVERFNRFVQTPGLGALPVSIETPVPNRLREVAPILIYSRMASVRAFEPLLGNARIEQLHALRIEFKKLRYAVEYFREVLGPEAKHVIEVIKKLQDHLGELNDANVATQLLRRFLDDWDASQAALPIAERQNPGGIIAYLAYQHARRHELMITFQQAWEEFARPEFRQALAMSIAVL